MVQDGLDNVVVASIVHEEEPLANAPERPRAEDRSAVLCRRSQRLAKSVGRVQGVHATPEIALIGDGIQAHEDGEVLYAGGNLAGIISSRWAAGYDHMSVVFRSKVRRAAGGHRLLIGEDLIGH